MLIEQDNNALLLSDFRGDEDRDVSFILFGAKGKADGLKAKVVEAIQDFFSKTG